MTQLKVSKRPKWHNLYCPSPLTISINDAWEYLDDCTYYFTDEELHELEDLCNFKSSCRYEKSRTLRLCPYWYPAWTKSIISYNCVYDHDDKTTIPTTTSEIANTQSSVSTSSTENYLTSSNSVRTPLEQNTGKTIYDKSTTRVTVSSNKAVKVTTSEITNTQSIVSTSSTDNFLTPSNSAITPLEQNTGNTNAGVIAGSVVGVLGILALLLLLLYCIWKRKKAIKQKDTSTSNATHAVGQNSTILYVVPEHISSHTHDPPPAYTNPYDNPDQDHIYINDEAITSQNSEHQQANDYNHIHGAHINNSIQNDDYNHTDTGLNLSGRPGEDYNHISVSGRNVSTENQMDDGYNQTGGQENDDYNHLANSYGQNKHETKHMDDYEDHLKQISSDTSNSKKDYANIGIEERNNDTVDFEPDDTYVYS